MRKLLFLLAFAPFFSFAQVNSAGIKTGLIFSLPQEEAYETHFGFNLGLTYRRFITERISIVAEPGFLRTGKSYQIEFIDLPDVVRENYYYDYFDLPILASYQYPLPLIDSYLGVQSGISPMFLLSAGHRQLGTDVTSELRNFTLQYLLGVSGHYMMDPIELGINLRYGYNLGGTYTEQDYRINYINILLNAAYRF